MSDIDMILGQVRMAPLPTALAALDNAVLGSLTAMPERGAVAKPIGMAAIAALAIGILGGLPGSKGEAIAAVAPLGASSSLAPSTLLVGER